MSAVRPATKADRKAVFRVHASAFGQEAEAKLVNMLTDGDFSVVSLLTEEEGKVIAHVLLSKLDVTVDGKPVRALALAPVGVRPRHQHQGLGTELIRTALGAAHALEWQAVIVVGDPDFYGRFGFKTETIAHLACSYAGPYLMGLELEADSLAGTSGSINYPPPFTAL
jgi:putative acetyltransferase